MRLVPILAVLLLLAGCGDSGAKPPKSGDLPPPFTLTALTGDTIDFPVQMSGKVVVVRFWASWCPFCKAEMRSIQSVWADTRGKGVEVLAVNVGQERGEIADFVAKLGVTYPVLLDPGSKVARRYGVTALPMTLLIGRDGRVMGRILGEADEATFRAKLEELL